MSVEEMLIIITAVLIYTLNQLATINVNLVHFKHSGEYVKQMISYLNNFLTFPKVMITETKHQGLIV